MSKKTICVIDLKAFYSYVECIDRGLDPWTTPLVVADISRSVNTIILSVTPFLKLHGVPSRLRLKELPKGYDYIYATPRMSRYIEKSCEVISIMMEFVSETDMHIYSIDEAFIDLTSYISYYHKTGREIVKDILNKIKTKTGLEATAGIGENFFLAKIALDNYAKKDHDGIAALQKSEIAEKLWTIQPLSKIWGIGPRMEKKLNKIGIHNLKDLVSADKQYIINTFGIMGEQLIEHAKGNDESDIHESYEPKARSISFGQTLPRDFNMNEVHVIIHELCEDLSSKLRRQKEMTDLVSLTIIYSSNMGGFSHQLSLLKPSDDTEELFNALMEIYKKYIQDLPIRQVHINYAHLQPYSNYEQIDLFNDRGGKKAQHNLQLMIDEIHNKYGKNILLRASALTKSSTAIERNNQIGGHRK